MKSVFCFSLVLVASAAMPQSRWLDAQPEAAAYRAAAGDAGKLRQAVTTDVVWDTADTFRVRLGDTWTKRSVDRPNVAQPSEAPSAGAAPPSGRPGGFGQRPPRGGSFRQANSPDGKWIAKSDGYNVSVQAEGGEAKAITFAGGADTQIQYGAVSWVYGEELGQTQALGWSPSGRYLWYYRFDNKPVTHFAILDNSVSTKSAPLMLPYPKAGDPNPVVDLFVYDRESGESRLVSSTVSDDRAYVFDIEWARDEDTLFFHTMNRRQSVRTMWRATFGQPKPVRVHQETNPGGYVSSSWAVPLPEKGSKTFFTTEANGFMNYAELDLKTGKVVPFSNLKSDVQSVLWRAGNEGLITAFRPDVPQHRGVYHVVKGAETLVTTRPLNVARVWMNGTGTAFVAREEAPGVAPELVVYRKGQKGTFTAAPLEWKHSDYVTSMASRVKRIFFPAADGTTPLLMTVELPANYAPGGNFPVIFDVYNGPETTPVRATFDAPSALTAFGFVVVSPESRGGSGRGRDFRNAAYLKLGITEIDDIAAAAKHLISLGYSNKMGVYGTSYGGYTSTMAILRYPELFKAAVASSSVTDWKHYDTIYTERYMGLPQTDGDAYKAGSALTYTQNLKGNLLLFYGTRDDNVHPSNTLELLAKFRREGAEVDVAIGPNEGHAYVGTEPMIRYFVRHLRDKN